MENNDRMQAWRLKMVGSQWEKELKVTRGSPGNSRKLSFQSEGTVDSKTRKSLKNQGHSAGES